MRSLTLAVLSFMLGATLVSLYGNQTPKQQPSQSPQEPNLDMGSAPIVPPGIRATIGRGMTVKGGLFVLDGLDCTACNLDNLTLRYGGGVYQLDHATFSNSVKIELSGAAANTVAFLSNLGIGLCKFPTPMERPNPNKPIIQTANFEKPVIIDLQSPYGQP
jgi:hypothetical protein